jgi:hypothetical protein
MLYKKQKISIKEIKKAIKDFVELYVTHLSEKELSEIIPNEEYSYILHVITISNNLYDFYKIAESIPYAITVNNYTKKHKEFITELFLKEFKKEIKNHDFNKTR